MALDDAYNDLNIWLRSAFMRLDIMYMDGQYVPAGCQCRQCVGVISVCVCVCVSQVCVINRLSGQFICWVTSCNFPPDSMPLCQVGIILRAHDKTLHLSASLSRFFFFSSSECCFILFCPCLCFLISFVVFSSTGLNPFPFSLLYLFFLPSTASSSALGMKKGTLYN